MKSLQEWAEYYRGLGLWVFPYNLTEDSWLFWKNKKEQDYQGLFKSFNWDSSVTGIKVVAGKKGIRVLSLRGLDKEEQINKVLGLLSLPLDYPWIIETKETDTKLSERKASWKSKWRKRLRVNGQLSLKGLAVLNKKGEEGMAPSSPNIIINIRTI